MAKNKSVTIGEYIVEINAVGAVKVYRIPKSTIAALKDCAAKVNFEVKDIWFAQVLGRNLLKEFCDGEMSGVIGEYHIERREDNHIDVYQEFGNTKDALRKISNLIGFKYSDGWNTQQFGRELVKFVEENGLFDKKKLKKRMASISDEKSLDTECDKIWDTTEEVSTSLDMVSDNETDEDKLKGKKVITITVGGRCELFYAAAVDDPDFDEKDYQDMDDSEDEDEYNAHILKLEKINTHILNLEDDRVVDFSTCLEFAVIFEKLVLYVDGEEIELDWEFLGDHINEVSAWYAYEPAFKKDKVVLSMMHRDIWLEQNFKIAIDEKEDFDLDKLEFITLGDNEYFYNKTCGPSNLLVNEIIYDGIRFRCQDELFPGGLYMFGESWCMKTRRLSVEPLLYYGPKVEYYDDIAIMPNNRREIMVTNEIDNDVCVYLQCERLDGRHLNMSNCLVCEDLDCCDTGIELLDISKNIKLKSLNCSDNPDLKELDLSNNINLERLYACGTGISGTLDLSNLTKLEYVDLVGTKCETLILPISRKGSVNLEEVDNTTEIIYK